MPRGNSLAEMSTTLLNEVDTAWRQRVRRSQVRMLLEARNERLLGRLHRRLERDDLLIVDELGFVPFDRPPAVNCSSTGSLTATSGGRP